MNKLFLLPLLLCVAWTLFLQVNQVPLRQGKKGYIYIIAISSVVIGALSLLLWITADQNIGQW
ncbi:hypothetical protein [Shewanella gelidii]|uniref:Uncharacterized protein n=1 Tax=Shewanella gelidii TaxID=1642821 RepID=A0A917JJX0_9GAMM|nr:hypothetical protein [Shewanella gelidii]MCL1096574.1 hypothetical protein [Shewanella gelidii]GGI68506.1 hypothetical protein GCM10009332_02080 [Shewanella gelidii]